jgi:hypothetical protein
MSNEPWLFYAEYPSDAEEAFRQSGRSRFPGLPEAEEFEDFEHRGRLTVDIYGNIEFEPDENGPLRITQDAFAGPPEGCVPVLSVDPSSGTGGDYTAMVGGWLEPDGTPNRVLFWHSNMVEPAEYAEQAMIIGNFLEDYNGRPALVAVERQGGYGDTAIHVMRTNGYKNLYVHRYTGHRKYRQEQTFGFPMTPARRPLVIDALARWLDWESGMVMVGIDPLLRKELGAFVVKPDGKVAADVGMHDDLVMATAIWLYVCEENPSRATKGLIGEPGDNIQVFSVAHIFEEAEKVRRLQAIEDSREMRRYRRQKQWL